jgi:hypothetical protein
MNLVGRGFNDLREERGPSDADARDGSGEGENDDVDERRIATTSTIGFCDCTIPIYYT